MRLPLPQFATQNRHPGYIAEVIETATTEFLAQCLEPEDLSFAVMPPFGSWVKAIDEESGNQIYAVVYHATTSPIDSVHQARALGMSLSELREQQPQIFAMLKTEFRAAIVGFRQPEFRPETSRNGSTNGSTDSSDRSDANRDRTHSRTPDATVNATVNLSGTLYQHLPPRPPQVHQAVYACEPNEVVQFSQQLDFLRTLLQLTCAPVDALTAAAIREIYQLRQADRSWLVEVGRALSLLLKDDYDRLRIILSQIHL